MFPLATTLCIQRVKANTKCHLHATLYMQTHENIHAEGMQKLLNFSEKSHNTLTVKCTKNTAHPYVFEDIFLL